MTFTGPQVIAPTAAIVPAGTPALIAAPTPVAVPKVVNGSEAQAEKTLIGLGLRVVKRYVIGEPDGAVYSQRPMPPATVASGFPVTIEILKAPPEGPAQGDISEVAEAVKRVEEAVAQLKTSAATKEAVASLGKDIRDLRDRIEKQSGRAARDQSGA